jgi:hypothetical protein
MSLLIVQRLWALVIALLLGHFFILVLAQDAWTEYWLIKDGQQGVAVVTKVLWTGHNAVAYRYSVNRKEYTGKDARNSQDPSMHTWGRRKIGCLFLRFSPLAITPNSSSHSNGSWTTSGCLSLASNGIPRHHGHKSKK